MRMSISLFFSPQATAGEDLSHLPMEHRGGDILLRESKGPIAQVGYNIKVTFHHFCPITLPITYSLPTRRSDDHLEDSNGKLCKTMMFGQPRALTPTSPRSRTSRSSAILALATY